MRIDVSRQRMILSRLTTSGLSLKKTGWFSICGPVNRAEVTHMVELDRQLELAPGTPVSLQVFIEGNKGVAYANNTVAMNFRAYDLQGNNWGVFASEGNATFKDVTISTYEKVQESLSTRHW